MKYNSAVTPRLRGLSVLSAHHLIAIGLLLIFAAQVIFPSPLNSAAFDEEYHVGAGYAYLKTGDPRLSTEHPPLVNLWNALPLLFLELKLPLDNPAWIESHTDNFGDVFLWQANIDRAIPIVLLGRLPIVFLGLILGAVIYRWTRALFGNNAALLALTLFAFDPNLIAQSRLSTTDLGLAFMMTLAMWRLWVWLEKPARRNLIFVGVATGLALTTKFTALTLAPLFLFAAIIHPSSQSGMKGRIILDRPLRLAIAGLIALLVIWIVYGFEIKDGLPAATYWRGLIKIFTEYSQGYPTFLFGEVSRTGWWYYFPITFALKTPLPTLIFGMTGLVAIIARRAARRASAVWLPPLVLMAFALLSPLAIGYRHIMPIQPFVIIVGGGASQILLADTSALRWKTIFRAASSVLLIGWLIVGTLAIYPYHLSYFNELAGGPDHGDRVLVDSNLDWGQDLPALKMVMEERGLDCVNLSYFGTSLPASYGVRYSALPGYLHFLTGPEMDSFNPYTPEPGVYAISVSSLHLGLYWGSNDLYAYFRDKTPVARAGYSIRLYDVRYPPGTSITRAVIMGKPAYFVPPDQLSVTPNARVNVKWIDNPDAFIFAMNGSARYLTDNPLPFDRPLRREFRAAGQTNSSALIVDARPIVQAHLDEWQSSAKPRLPDGTVLNWPVNFGDRLALIGYRLESRTTPGGAIDLITYWQVIGELDLCDSLAYFAHVTTDVPQAIQGQYDGWGVARRGLEVGDVIVQHARIPIKPDAQPGAYQLRLGLYSPDTSRRWTANGTSADHILLSPVEVAAP